MQQMERVDGFGASFSDTAFRRDIAEVGQPGIEEQDAAPRLADAFLDLANALRVAIVVLDGGEHVLAANDRARNILCGDGLALCATGLRATDPRDGVRLSTTVRQALVANTLCGIDMLV